MGRPVKPGPVIITNCIEIRLNWGDPGVSGEIRFTNILHATFTTKPTIDAALAETLFTGFKNGLTTSNWTSFVSPSTSFRGVWVKDIGAANLPWFESSGADVAGTGAGTALAESIAVAVTALTAKAGREWHGRSYLGGLDASAQSDSRHHSVPAGTAAVAFMQALRTTAGTSQLQLAVGQRELLQGTSASGAVLPPRASHAEPITGYRITNSRLDTQRRRLGR